MSNMSYHNACAIPGNQYHHHNPTNHNHRSHLVHPTPPSEMPISPLPPPPPSGYHLVSANNDGSDINNDEENISRSVTISEARTHCVSAFERLRVLREQGRFCDLILRTKDRQFPAHRCVLASCSPWFDSRLKMHKTVKEEINIDCQDLEAFYAVLSYFYTGTIVIDSGCVDEVLRLADYFNVAKLKGHCCEFLLRTLNVKNVIGLVQMGGKYNLSDLLRQCFQLLQKHFNHFQDSAEMLSLPYNTINLFLSSDCVYSRLSQEHILTFVASWVGLQPQEREDNFITLLSFIDWGSIDLNFLCNHLDKHDLYQISVDALHNILHLILMRCNINLGPKYLDLYQTLQEQLFPEQDLDELNDSNSFLSIAINSAVKDLEHSEVDPEWFLQNEPPPVPPHPPPPPPLPTSGILNNEHYRMVGDQPSTSNNLIPLPQSSSSSSTIYGRHNSKIKDPLDFDIVMTVINEQSLSDEKSKYRDSSNVKRYDPKFRALTEVFRQETDDGSEDTLGMSYSKYGLEAGERTKHDQESSKFRYTETRGQSSNTVSANYPITGMNQMSVHSNERHQHQDIMPNYVSNKPHWSNGPNSLAQQQSMEHFNTYPTPNPCDEEMGILVPNNPPHNPMESFSENHDHPPNPQLSQEVKKEVVVEQMQKEEQQQQQQKTTILDKRDDGFIANSGGAGSTGDPPLKSTTQVQKQHVKKAKLLAEHRSTIKEDLLTESTMEEKKKKVNKSDKAVEKRPTLNCSQCSFGTVNSLRMNSHMKRIHGKNSKFDCSFCNFSSKWKKETWLHIKQSHMPGPPYHCDKKECNYQNDKLYKVLAHRMTHSEVANFKCSFNDSCKFATRTNHRLQIHMANHNKKFSCEQCKKTFGDKRNLDKHMVSHTDIKQFSCSICGFKTKYKDHLKLHCRIHEGTAHKCDFPDCTYQTPKMSLLLAHKRTHTKEKNFKCDQCNKSFVENSQLTRHKSIHSDVFPFVCQAENCNFKTRRKDKLKTHVAKLHPNSIN